MLRQGVLSSSTLAVGMARLGQETQQIVFGTLEQLLEVDFGAPLHSLAICGQIHPLEEEILKFYSVENFNKGKESSEGQQNTDA
jgi:diphthine methyl ester synthase